MGSAPILPDKVTDTIDTMLKFGLMFLNIGVGLNIGTREQGFKLRSTSDGMRM